MNESTSRSQAESAAADAADAADAVAPIDVVVLVGHCGPDAMMLRMAVERTLPGVRVESALDEASVAHWRSPDRVWLVNRVLDGAFASDDGIGLIAENAERADAPRIMLVSNFEDAQARAESVGALPGFGKRDVYAERTADLLRSAARRVTES